MRGSCEQNGVRMSAGEDVMDDEMGDDERPSWTSTASTESAAKPSFSRVVELKQCL